MSATTNPPTDLPANVMQMADRLMEEGFIGMAEAARQIGTFRKGRPCHPSTITRWATHGIKMADGTAVKLEHVRLGERIVTSRAAIVRFVTRQQDADNVPLCHLSPRSHAKRRKALEAADKQLSEMGV